MFEVWKWRAELTFPEVCRRREIRYYRDLEGQQDGVLERVAWFILQ